LAVCCALCLIPGALSASHIELVSVADPSLAADSGGGNSLAGPNGSRTVSADGRFTVFTSVAANLAPGQSDGNAANDVFLYDRTAGAIILVSHAAAGSAIAANGSSDQPTISADGSHVAYVSAATNLVAGQVAGVSPNQFLWDRASGTNVLASHTAASAVTPASQLSGSRSVLSQDGLSLVFTSGGTNLVAGQSGPAGESANLFLFDATTGTNTLITHDAAAAATVGDNASGWPVLSADGRYTAYHSGAGNLVSGYVSSGGVNSNVYLWDRTTGTNTPGQPPCRAAAPRRRHLPVRLDQLRRKVDRLSVRGDQSGGGRHRQQQRL
jgi:Tol biopolymer transport system component